MHCSEDSQDDRDRLEMVAAILTESLEHPLFPREQMNEQAKHLRAQMKHILNLIEEWNYQTLDARRIEDLARDARFLRCQTGQILRLAKQQIEETEGQRKQLAAHGDILQNILLNVAPEPSQSPMYVHPRITWKSVFKCECQSAKPPHPSPRRKRKMRTLRQRCIQFRFDDAAESLRFQFEGSYDQSN